MASFGKSGEVLDRTHVPGYVRAERKDWERDAGCIAPPILREHQFHGPEDDSDGDDPPEIPVPQTPDMIRSRIETLTHLGAPEAVLAAERAKLI